MVTQLLAGTLIEPYITAGTVIIAALIAGVSSLGAAWLTSVGRKIDKTVKQTATTGNGFAGEVREFIDEMRTFREDSTKRDDFQNQLLIGIDQRVTNLEETKP